MDQNQNQNSVKTKIIIIAWDRIVLRSGFYFLLSTLNLKN